jgi:hypothetical protein
MKRFPGGIVTLALALAGLLAAAPSKAADVVVLKGGERIELKEAPMQRGNNALLTRADGTLFSVPMTEIDWDATRALKKSKPAAAAPAIVAPPSTPAEAVRSGKSEKARVRVTDADVSHQMETADGKPDKQETLPVSTPRVEVLDYTQTRNGDTVVVSGQLHNPGNLPTTNVHLKVTATGDDGAKLSTASATLSNGTIEPGKVVSFSVALPVGERTVTSLRFTPEWWTPTPPAAASSSPAASAGSNAAAPAAGASAAAAPASPAAPAASSKPPGPAPTPYGQGMLYAAPAASAPSVAPADGKTGYIPGASTPDNQPKPPQ